MACASTLPINQNTHFHCIVLTHTSHVAVRSEYYYQIVYHIPPISWIYIVLIVQFHKLQIAMCLFIVHMLGLVH